jgi:hypothetical protein
MITISKDLVIEYSGNGTTTLEELLVALSDSINPKDTPEGFKAAEAVWHEIAVQTTMFLKHCPFRCHHDLEEEVKRKI